ncbi:MAG TPA: OmpA family protein [Longimicrobiales bacterium]
MRSHRTMVQKASRGVAVAVLVLLAGCGYAKRSDVESQLAQLRQEMQSGDEAVSTRVDQLEGRMDALERDLQALRSEFNVKIERLEGLLAFDVPVNFDFDKADLREADKPVLERFAAIVRDYYPNAVITVEGFTDPAGSRAYNEKLGKARAETVKSYLTSVGGLPADRIRTVSYGETPERLVVPGAQGPGAAGLPNRRVSLVIDYTGPEVQRLTSATN